MPSFLEDVRIDTASVIYPKTGIRLPKFVTNAYGNDIINKIKKGDFIIFFNGKNIKYNKNFRNYRVKEDTTVVVKPDAKQLEIPENMFG